MKGLGGDRLHTYIHTLRELKYDQARVKKNQNELYNHLS